MSSFIRNLENSLQLGFINHAHNQSGNYKPELLINNSADSINVLSTLLEEMENSRTFIFSVAFITESGLATFKSHLLDLKRKGIQGRILTSTFLHFNQPKVFRELMKITNIEVRLTNVPGFHAKGYIFEHEDHVSLIVGSSNLTAHALKMNYEWNVKLTSHENGEIVHHFKNQFEDVWSKSIPLSEGWVQQYEESYAPVIDQQVINTVTEFPGTYITNSVKDAIDIVPNKMQVAALDSIQGVREAGNDKGLIISATGTGKTYLSAFDVRRYAPKRMLFIVHREQILSKAQSDFKRVLGGLYGEFGILSGSLKQTNAKYLFATIQTISKENVLHQFEPDEFEYILIDEVHKAGASSYHRVINYFKPSFLMGMTATPERTDDFNIYELFDYNIAYEIRLQEALAEDMLCPFHYFGVTDMEYDGEVIDDATALSKLVTDERVDHILEKVNYYGHSGDYVRGLMFCSRKEEAVRLSHELNQRGLRTVALTGDDSQEERLIRVDELEQGLLDYILTVDIFNEGIDIPSVNQVVMLRQTQSSIVFIQQLGRGLRKHNSKEFVTIIDFIGNYKNNYMIPSALAGDQSQNKDNIRRNTKDTSYIKGVSTINFEEIAKKQIFKSINNTNLKTLAILRESYIGLKNKLGRIPFLYDFEVYQSIDPIVAIEKFCNHHRFLTKMNEEEGRLTEYEESVLTMLSLEVLDGKRIHEVILLDMLLPTEKVNVELFKSRLKELNIVTSESTLRSVFRVLDLTFFVKNSKKKYGDVPILIKQGNSLKLNPQIQESIRNNSYFLSLLHDCIQVAYEKNKVYDNGSMLTLYQKYSRKDACKLLNWESDESSTVYGYKPKFNTCPIFVTYHKNDEVESSVNYGDEFISRDIFRWYTRSNRTLNSNEVKEIIEAQKRNIDLHILIKKDDAEGTDFYYLGKATPDQTTVEQSTMLDKNGKVLPVVHMNLIMEHSVDSKLYNYFVND